MFRGNIKYSNDDVHGQLWPHSVPKRNLTNSTRYPAILINNYAKETRRHSGINKINYFLVTLESSLKKYENLMPMPGSVSRNYDDYSNSTYLRVLRLSKRVSIWDFARKKILFYCGKQGSNSNRVLMGYSLLGFHQLTFMVEFKCTCVVALD